ncbi:MAG: hypothetical protein ACPG06_00170 [Alphaproteobacteria bacterium]
MRHLLAVSVLGLAVAACAPPPTPPGPSSITPKRAMVAKAVPAKPQKAKPAPQKQKAIEPTQTTPPPPDPAELIGRNVSQTRTLLGKPVMVRRERGAALWLYTSGRCNAHILTNATNRGEIVRSLHFRDSKTQRSFDPESEAGKYCFAKLVEDKTAP